MKFNFVIMLFIGFGNIVFSQSNYHSITNLKNELKNITIEENNYSITLSTNLSEKKNTGLAILYSLVLPGMGELYADGYSSGVYFTIADGVLWSTLLGMNIYGNWQESRYKSFAKVYAGIDPNGKGKDFFATISAYQSIDDYNNEKALERDFRAMLDKEKFYWSWNSTEQRRTYRSMWTSSEQTFNNMRFVVGGLILNRVVSIINAVRLTSRYNKKIEEDNLSMNVLLRRNVFGENEVTFIIQQKF